MQALYMSPAEFLKVVTKTGHDISESEDSTSIIKVKDTALEKHRKTLKKIVEFFIVNSIGLLSSLPSNRTCWTVFILIF